MPWNVHLHYWRVSADFSSMQDLPAFVFENLLDDGSLMLLRNMTRKSFSYQVHKGGFCTGEKPCTGWITMMSCSFSRLGARIDMDQIRGYSLV